MGLQRVGVVHRGDPAGSGGVMLAFPLLLSLLAQVPAPPPAPPVETADADARLVLFVLLDDGDASRGVDGAIIRRVTLPPYDASHVDGVPLRLVRYQGFHEDAPGWRIGQGGRWTRILHPCPCGEFWAELDFYVHRHQELMKPRTKAQVWVDSDSGKQFRVRFNSFGEPRAKPASWGKSWNYSHDEYDPPLVWPAAPTRRIAFREIEDAGVVLAWRW